MYIFKTLSTKIQTDHTCNAASHSFKTWWNAFSPHNHCFKHKIIVICNGNIWFNHRNTTVWSSFSLVLLTISFIPTANNARYMLQIGLRSAEITVVCYSTIVRKIQITQFHIRQYTYITYIYIVINFLNIHPMCNQVKDQWRHPLQSFGQIRFNFSDTIVT